MKIEKKGLITFFHQLLFRIKDDQLTDVSARLSYYFMLSLFPYLILIINVIALVPLANRSFVTELLLWLPVNTRDLLDNVLFETIDRSSTSLLSFGFLGLIWAASKGTNALMKSLNLAFDVEETRPFWKRKIYSLLTTLILVLLVFVAVPIMLIGRNMLRTIFDLIAIEELSAGAFWLASQALTIGLIALVFAILYRYVPNKRVGFFESLLGALFTTMAWGFATKLFSFYVSNFGNYSKLYGSIGAIIVLLLWLYISSFTLLLGGEISATLIYMRKGKTIEKYELLSGTDPLKKVKDLYQKARQVLAKKQ